MLLRCDILTYLSHLLLVLNSSMNIVIYCWKVVPKAERIRMGLYFSSGWKIPERPSAPFNISRRGSKVAQQLLRPHKSPPPQSNGGETWREDWKGRRLAAGLGVPDWSPPHRHHHNMSQALLGLWTGGSPLTRSIPRLCKPYDSLHTVSQGCIVYRSRRSSFFKKNLIFLWSLWTWIWNELFINLYSPKKRANNTKKNKFLE